MRVLLVEDEDALRDELAGQLRDEGFAVDATGSGEEGEFFGLEYPVDAAIVDLGLPDRPGSELIERWRREGRAFPVLILTARGRWEDKVAGLEIGADDYLVKPFHSEELMARLRALLRRASGWTRSHLRCGPVAMDLGAKRVDVDGEPVELTALEYKVLEFLMLRTGDVLSKTELTEHLYEDDAERDSNVLEVIIGRLRKKLDPQRELNPIETIRGQGYRFRLPREQENA